MRTDISSREDIAALINAFYEKVKVNPAIGHYFNKVVNVDWDAHLPVMYDFWEGIVFSTPGYTGNPINVHKHVHALHPLSKTDFEEWLRIFHETVDEMYEGEKAELIKQRATSIAIVMQLKITNNNILGQH